MMGEGSRTALVAATLAVTLGSAAPPAAAVETPRSVLGTVRVTGQVQTAIKDSPWRPLTGGALVDGMAITTAEQSTALLQLSNGDVVALADNTTCTVEGPSSRPRVRLQRGRLSVHLLTDSPTTIETPRTVVRASEFGPAATSGRHEALLAVASGTTVVEAHSGGFELVGPGNNVSQLEAGQVATLSATADEPTITQVAAGERGEAVTTAAPAEEEGWKGPFGWGPWTTGLVATGIVAAGVGIGVGVSSGGGGDGGSPFRTPQP